MQFKKDFGVRENAQTRGTADWPLDLRAGSDTRHTKGSTQREGKGPTKENLIRK